jgi:hypothetical protein
MAIHVTMIKIFNHFMFKTSYFLNYNITPLYINSVFSLINIWPLIQLHFNLTLIINYLFY